MTLRRPASAPPSAQAETPARCGGERRKPTQEELLLLLLAAANARGVEWVPLPDILALGIAQYNARIHYLRRAGHDIENKTETVDGTRLSWFRLRGAGTQDQMHKGAVASGGEATPAHSSPPEQNGLPVPVQLPLEMPGRHPPRRTRGVSA